MIRVADYVMQQLYANGINHIFMVTGRGALFLTDAVAAHKGLSSVCLHHEQAAAFAAVAYATYSGKPGACLVSTGCAGTNALTGVLNAWQDGIPCIFISGQNKLAETSRYTGIPLRTYGQQEADLIPVVASITKYAVMITDPKKIAFEVGKALYSAKEGRKGPVWIDIPLDIQNMRIIPNELEHFIPPDIHSTPRPFPKDIDYVVEALNHAKRPVVLIGSGVRSAESVQELKQFVENHSIPLTYSTSAPDIYGSTFPLSVGSAGTMGCSRAGNFTVQNSDLLIVLGCRLNSMTTGTDCAKFARDAKVIVVDIDPVEHSKKGVKIDKLIIADVKLFLDSLQNSRIKQTDKTWRDKCLHWKNIFPKCEIKYKESEKVDLYYLADVLSDVLPADSIFVSDSGLIELILPPNINFKESQRCIHPASQGSMGYAIPAIVGAHYASNRPVITVVGDGSIMMNLQELATIHFNNIPAKIFVINNNAYSIIRKRQLELFGLRTIGTDSSNGVGCPDFEKVAFGFGLPYSRIENSENLHQQLNAIINTNGPVLCEIMGLDDQDYITSSHARNSKGRVVHRPLEDQMPYLDRDLFLKEMIIEPIDQ